MAGIKRLIQKAIKFQQGVTQCNISWFAAACAFYTFFSLFPIVILVISILPYTSLTQDLVFSLLSDYLPTSMETLIHMIEEDEDVCDAVFDRFCEIMDEDSEDDEDEEE